MIKAVLLRVSERLDLESGECQCLSLQTEHGVFQKLGNVATPIVCHFGKASMTLNPREHCGCLAVRD